MLLLSSANRVIADLRSAYDTLEGAFLFRIISLPVTPHTVFVKRIIFSSEVFMCPCWIAFYFSDPFQQPFDSNPVFQYNCRLSKFDIIRDLHKHVFYSPDHKINDLPCPLEILSE